VSTSTPRGSCMSARPHRPDVATNEATDPRIDRLLKLYARPHLQPFLHHGPRFQILGTQTKLVPHARRTAELLCATLPCCANQAA
jgi:hypothetical protein